MISLAVCVASYNRREVTLKCLERLFMCELPQGTSLKVYLLDDASPDATADAIARGYPQVRLLSGTGQLYWAGGMRMAFGEALAAKHDFYLWLNDDVQLSKDSISRALGYAESMPRAAIFVGSTREPNGTTLTYGGQVASSKLFPWKFKHVEPGTQPVMVDAINGNFVLIPHAVAEQVGNIPPTYTHGIADFDYGLRAKKLGFSCWLLPGFVGACSNHPEISWRKHGLNFRERLQKLEDPLGYPWRPRLRYLFTHFPLWAPALFLKPYFDIAIISLKEAVRAEAHF